MCSNDFAGLRAKFRGECACLALGMTADLDDDNDGVTDLLDPEPANGAVYQLTSGMGGGYKLPTSLTVLKTQE